MTQLATMNLFVTGHANRLAVVDAETKTREVRPRFDVMGLQFSTYSAASALVTVSAENLFAPSRNARLVNFAFGGGCAALPIPMTSSTSRGIRTQTRAELLSRIALLKWLAAKLTRTRREWCANIPTRPRAVFGKCAVGSCLERLAADNADAWDALASVLAPNRVVAFAGAARLSFCEWMEGAAANLASQRHGQSVRHGGLIARCGLLCQDYCAVILERMATAFPALAIERV
jgi:hypothetical protein